MINRTARATKLIAIRALLGVVALIVASSCLPTPFGPISALAGQDDQDGTDQSPIRVRVEVVSAPVVVRNVKGEYVLDLGMKNFRIFDNGTQQEIESFELGGERRFSAAIVIETSSRIEGLLPLIRPTGILFTKTILGETGEAAVFGYNDNVDELLDFTSDQDAIEKTISNLQEGSSGACPYGALSKAASVLRNRPASRRRIIIAVGESTDTGCKEKMGEVVRQLQFANITVYSVGLSLTAAEWHGPEKQASTPSATPPGIFGLAAYPGNAQTPLSVAPFSGNMNLRPLATWIAWPVLHATGTLPDPLGVFAASTGGLYQSTFDDDSIEVAIDQIGAELSAQYTLSYDVARTDAGGYHKIKVEVVDRPALKARARPGYYMGPR